MFLFLDRTDGQTRNKVALHERIHQQNRHRSEDDLGRLEGAREESCLIFIKSADENMVASTDLSICRSKVCNGHFSLEFM